MASPAPWIQRPRGSIGRGSRTARARGSRARRASGSVWSCPASQRRSSVHEGKNDHRKKTKTHCDKINQISFHGNLRSTTGTPV